MGLLLVRNYNCNLYCIGKLYLNNVYLCDTLEDTDRGLNSSMSINEIRNKKVAGVTAIPVGTYPITFNQVSPRFSRTSLGKEYGGKLPRLLNVPGYEGVLIHWGNTAKDTEGCILVGNNSIQGMVTNSQNTFRKVMEELLKNRPDSITISRTY